MYRNSRKLTPPSHHAIRVGKRRTSSSPLSFVVHLILNICYSQVDQGQNTYLRIPPNNNPVTDVTSTDLTCNVGGLTGSGVSTASIAAGASITYVYKHLDCYISSSCFSFTRVVLSGTSTHNVPAKMLFLVDTRDPSLFMLPRHPPPLPHSMVRVLSGLRYISLGYWTRLRSSGPLMLSIAIQVSLHSSHSGPSSL